MDHWEEELQKSNPISKESEVDDVWWLRAGKMMSRGAPNRAYIYIYLYPMENCFGLYAYN